MGSWKRIALVSAVALSVVLAACSASDRVDGTEQTTSGAASTSTPVAGTEVHNNADVWFVRHQIRYHQQAIQMSDILLAKRGVDPRVTELAKTIKAARGPELQQMQQWLSQWDSPEQSVPSTGGMQTTAPGGMLGQLSERELDALRQATGVDAGRLFLTQMIAHHQGALSLAKTEIEEGQYPAALALARAIADVHQQEIDTMRRILASL